MNEIHVDLRQNKGIFYIEVLGEKIAYMTFLLTDNKHIVVNHTVVKDAYEGRGYAKALMKEMLVYADNNNFTLIPQCGFVREQMKYYPEYKHLIEKEDA